MSRKTNLVLVAENSNSYDKYKDLFESNGYHILYFQYTPRVLALLKQERIEIVIIEFKKSPSLNSPLIKLLAEIKSYDQKIEVLLTAPHFSPDFAVAAVQKGATDCITLKPDPKSLLEVLHNLTEFKNLCRQTGLLERKIREHYTFQGMISRNPYMLEIFSLIRRLAKHFTTILITGETGTGKEMVARALHDLSPRSGEKYVACNCSAFPASLLERELFGHTKGAFTGATDSKPGIFEFANGGTVFLDEIAEMDISLQAKLLRVLDDHMIRRIGSPQETKVDVQVITATNRNLRQAVKERRFREDLFYRVNVLEIHLPPLRERKDDIPLLCHYFLSQFNDKFKKNLKGISRKAQIQLMNHTWEGNVRELQNVIESAAILSSKDYISDQEIIRQLEKTRGTREKSLPYGEDLTLEELERQHITHILEKTGGNKARTAAILGLSRRSLYRKMEKLQIN